MQELEKILKEIGKEIAGSMGRKREGLLLAHSIIRNHMNDGWIPVEERLPDTTDEMEVTLSDGDVTGAWYNRASKIWIIDDIDEDYEVIAWKPHSEPYCPEEKEE